MSDSTRRVLRTAYQIAFAVITGIPLIMVGLPPDLATQTVIASFAAWTAGVSALINRLEDAGVIPAWLK